ncbi:MoaD/ThiS family protein [Labilibacter marinus]|uniref:MoaD/ThiS family protein n=1 Tax=Labilibacter marinus TaxID=1477105 RepID=UPI00117BCD03|nr:MoaD/ThiS family protein [Labilibacter marinus]
MIKINFFAGLKRTFPKSIEWEVNENTSVNSLIEELKSNFPDAEELLTRSRAAINEEFVEMATLLKDGTEVFIIPPSSGG